MVEAQQLVLAAWAVISALLLGLGLLERRVFGQPLQRADDLWLVFWMGWAILLSGLQVWHLFLPVDDRARIAFLAIAAAGWVLSGLAPWRLLARSLPRSIPAIALVLLGAWWLSNRSLAGPGFGDTGMYLIPTVHWYKTFAIVPGLANVFVPLGHNLSYFLYGALLDGGPLTQRIYSVINSLLALALIGRGLLGCTRLLGTRSGRTAADLYHALSLLPLTELVFGLFLTSPSPDTGVLLFGLVLGGQMVEVLADSAPSRASVIRLVFLCAVGLTIKLSIAGLALATAAIALVWWLWRCWPGTAGALRTALLCLLVALVPVSTWVLRNIISSGYPLYPANLLPLPVDWIAGVDATAWIQRPMAMAPLLSIFTDWPWWKTRLLSLGWAEIDALRPLAMVAVGFVLFVLLRPIEWWRVHKAAGHRVTADELPATAASCASLVPVMILVAPIAAFFFSFVNTPMPRYQGATLWILGADLFVLALASRLGRSGLLLRLGMVTSVLAAATMMVPAGASAWLPLKDFQPTSGPRLHTETVASGLVVQVPENHVCWYAPLPCTPEPHPGLRLRREGDLSGGFAIDPSIGDPSIGDPSMGDPSMGDGSAGDPGSGTEQP